MWPLPTLASALCTTFNQPHIRQWRKAVQTSTWMGKPDYEDADILEGSLELLYGFTPIVHSSAGSLWTYNTPDPSLSVRLRVPDTHARNWNLHAGSVWVAAIHLADQISSDEDWLSSTLPRLQVSPNNKVRILEIGAGTGLPSILLAKLRTNLIDQVIMTDYPDDGIMRALRENVQMNFDSESSHNSPNDFISVVPYDWLDTSPPLFEINPGFDLVIGCDVLWNSELHMPMLLAVERCLRKEPGAIALFVAGLHTGRYTIQRFLDRVSEMNNQTSLRLKSIEEREVNRPRIREWDAQREEGETEEERRRWVIRICLVWDE